MIFRNVGEEALSIKCSLCGANKNRKCIRMTSPRKGSATDIHQQRRDKILQTERESHNFLCTIPLSEIKVNDVIKSHKNGAIGKIIFIKRSDSVFLIKWDNGSESRMSHKDNTLMMWPEGYL